MKKIIIFIATITMLFSASTENITMNHKKFSIIQESYDIYDSKGEFIKLYADGNSTALVRLTLKDVTGGCASKSLQDGAYKVDSKGITLYSFWDRGGKAYLEPYGARIQRFELQKDGKLKKVSSSIYIEATRKKHDDGSGMEYLFHAPKNKTEQAQFDAYILDMERAYKGKFVLGKEAKILIKEVKKALQEKVKTRWRKN